MVYFCHLLLYTWPPGGYFPSLLPFSRDLSIKKWPLVPACCLFSLFPTQLIGAIQEAVLLFNQEHRFPV